MKTPVNQADSQIPSTGWISRLGRCVAFYWVGIMIVVNPVGAHHFKGLPHYNYFENYPQVPEEEFIGQADEYEMSLVVYDFQGIQKENVEQPDTVRFFLIVFNLRDNRIYSGPLTMEVLDGGKRIAAHRFDQAEQENLYSFHEPLDENGRYAVRVVLHDKEDASCTIPIRLSSQKINWGLGVAVALVIVVGVTLAGARKARVRMDRRELSERNSKRVKV